MKSSYCLCMVFLCFAGPLVAEPFKAVAENLPSGPVRILPVSSRAPLRDAPLSLRFRMLNSSPEFISRVQLTATAISEDGQFKGFYTFEVNANLMPGEEKFFAQSTSTFSVAPSDAVEIIPDVARMKTGTWLRPSFEGEDEENELRTLFESVGPDTCDARCAVKDELCSTKCVCGVQSFSCSCGGGTFSYTCTCQRCSN